MTSRQYGLEDLVRAYLHHLASRRSSEAKRRYGVRRFEAFAAAFDLTPDAVADPPRLGSLWGDALRALETMRSPFEGYLEAPRDVVALYRRHGQSIGEPLDEARAAVVALLVDVLAHAHGLDPAAQISSEDLQRHGVEPDGPTGTDDEEWL